MGYRSTSFIYFCQGIDLTDYSFLPNSLISMLTYLACLVQIKVILFQNCPVENCFLLILDPITKLYSVVLRRKPVLHENEAIGE